VVEDSRKNVIALRPRKSGMRWSLDAADATPASRRRILSGGYEDF